MNNPFKNLDEVAKKLRSDMKNNKFILLYAYNSVGKTRLSTAFKDQGKIVSATGETSERDTLYFNAFTEDQFSWDNDLEDDRERKLKLNADSIFFAGLESMEMENRIRPLLDRFADFGFRIDTTAWEVMFDRALMDKEGGPTSDGEEIANAVQSEKEPRHDNAINIKISRSEENVFIWCFFLAIVELALEDDGSGPYSWVKYIYIDDPISSLDEHNAIAVANHLASLLNTQENRLKTIISTHHPLFFNVLCREMEKSRKIYFLARDELSDGFVLRGTGKIPFFHHVAVLAELCEADRDDRLRIHHFGMLRAVMEKTASFHGYNNFSACFVSGDDDEESDLLARLTNIHSHGNTTLFELEEMPEEKKRDFRKILNKFIDKYPFNQDRSQGTGGRNE